MKKFLFIFSLFLVSLCGFAQNNIIYSVMLGSVDMREANLWLLTNRHDKFVCRVTAEGDNRIMEFPITWELNSNQEKVGNSQYAMGKVFISGLTPSTKYSYKIIAVSEINVFESTFTTPPDFYTRFPAPDFTIAVAGTVHNNESLYDEAFRIPGGEDEIFDKIAESKSSALIWAGGLESLRVADWGSRSGFFERFSYARTRPYMKKVLASQSNIGVMSAVSYGEPNSDKTLWNKKDSHYMFTTFWANPTTADNFMFTTFRYADARFFILDDCSEKDLLEPVLSKKQILGRTQLNQLCQALQASTDKFKVVVMNMPFANPVNTPENYASAENERREFLNFLNTKKIKGVFFVSGNKQYGEVSRLVRPGAYAIFDVTAGPVNARLADSAKEMNFFRVPGSVVLKRSFVTLSFTGPEDNRKVSVKYIGSKGESLFETSFSYADISSFN